MSRIFVAATRTSWTKWILSRPANSEHPLFMREGDARKRDAARTSQLPRARRSGQYQKTLTGRAGSLEEMVVADLAVHLQRIHVLSWSKEPEPPSGPAAVDFVVAYFAFTIIMKSLLKDRAVVTTVLQ